MKALLLQGTTTSYKRPSLRRHIYSIQKPFSWKATLFMTSQQLKEHCQRGNSFKCMIRGASLTSPYTQLDILSLPPVAPIFPPQSWSYHGKLPLYRWSHSAGILLAHRSCTAGATNHTKISDFTSLSLNLRHWVYDYFTFKYILLYSNYYYNY